jgi:hypothetical protein
MRELLAGPGGRLRGYEAAFGRSDEPGDDLFQTKLGCECPRRYQCPAALDIAEFSNVITGLVISNGMGVAAAVALAEVEKIERAMEGRGAIAGVLA